MPTPPTFRKSPLMWVFLQLLRFYQKTISPDHGIFRSFFPYGACRYTPTCSEYMGQSIIRYGIIGGVFRGVARLLRCHPWSQGGVDPVV